MIEKWNTDLDRGSPAHLIRLHLRLNQIRLDVRAQEPAQPISRRVVPVVHRSCVGSSPNRGRRQRAVSIFSNLSSKLFGVAIPSTPARQAESQRTAGPTKNIYCTNQGTGIQLTDKADFVVRGQRSEIWGVDGSNQCCNAFCWGL